MTSARIVSYPPTAAGLGIPTIQANVLQLQSKNMKFYRLGSGQENPDGPSILITDASTSAWKNIWRMQVPWAFEEGDIIHVSAEMEIRNDTSYSVETVALLLLTAESAPSSLLPAGASGLIISGANGHNVMPVPNGAHYSDTPKVAGYEVPADMANPYIFLRVRCRSGETPSPSYCTSMAGGYGQMTLLHFPKGLA